MHMAVLLGVHCGAGVTVHRVVGRGLFGPARSFVDTRGDGSLLLDHPVHLRDVLGVVRECQNGDTWQRVPRSWRTRLALRGQADCRLAGSRRPSRPVAHRHGTDHLRIRDAGDRAGCAVAVPAPATVEPAEQHGTASAAALTPAPSTFYARGAMARGLRFVCLFGVFALLMPAPAVAQNTPLSQLLVNLIQADIRLEPPPPGLQSRGALPPGGTRRSPRTCSISSSWRSWRPFRSARRPAASPSPSTRQAALSAGHQQFRSRLLTR